jgi:hypothetical protein
VRAEATLGTKRPAKAKPPSGEEKKNQLDLLDWAAEAIAKTAAATTAAAVAAKDAATRTFEELRVAFDRRSVKICSGLCLLLVACSGRPLSLPLLFVIGATVLSAFLTIVPWLVSSVPRLADRAVRASDFLATILLIVGVTAFATDLLMPSFSLAPPQQQVSIPKVEPLPVAAPTDERSLSEDAQRDAPAQAVKDAAQVADCLAKETAADKASQTFKWRERKFNKCKTEYETALTLKGLDTYCRRERERLDASGRALDSAVAKMCTTTGSTKRGR